MARCCTGFSCKAGLCEASGSTSGGSSSGGSTSGGSSSGGSSGGTACPSPGTAEARLPACAPTATPPVDVPAGCVPTVDGTLHLEEWSDAACLTVGSPGGDVAYVKYAGDTLYLAFSATPACGCGMAFAFDPDGNASLDGDEFIVSVFDDPSSTSGDRGDFVVQDGGWGSGSAPAGIVTACPGQAPNPINYEWSLPFAALGISAGTPHTFRFGLNHEAAGVWPPGLTTPNGGGSLLPSNPGDWGQLQSSKSWQ